MFKKFFSVSLLLIILLSFLLTGCGSGEDYLDEEISGFVGGPIGLKIGVMEGAPPQTVLDAGAASFSFIIPLENVGEAPVGPGTENPLVMARLSGIMYANFGLTEETATKTLNAKLEPSKRNFDNTILPGEINYISFDNLAYSPDVFESLALTIRAEVCYDYETHATTKFCMKRDVLESWEDASICMLRGVKSVGNSGAPLQITRVEEAPVANMTVQLNFVIEHVGNGVFYYRYDYSKLSDVCVFNEIDPNIYKLEVFVEPIEKDTYNIKCIRLDNQIAGGGAYGVVRMWEGAPVAISCFLTRTKPMSVRVYSDLLNIRLRYRYGDFLEVPIIIQAHP